MKSPLFSIVASLAIACPMTTQAEVTVSPAGVKVVWESLKKEFDGFSTYSSDEGVYVMLAVKGGGKNIISFDKKKSKASIKHGDKDIGGQFDFWNKTSKDGKTMRIEVNTDQLPKGEMKPLKVTGSLILVTASKTETKASGPRELKKDDKLTFSNDFNCVVSEIGKPKRGDDELEVTLKWTKDIPELANVRFYDEAGKLIESRKGGWSKMGSLGNRTVTHNYLLKKKSAILKIEVDLWSDIENITLPLDLNLGMSAGK